jgi:hypothetical protein
MRIGKKSAEPLAVNLYHLNAERIGVSLFVGKHDGDEHNMERRWGNRMSMNAEHWIMRAAPEALAGVGNRARVIELQIVAGSGAECDYCHRSIGANATEYEVKAIIFNGTRTLHFHRLCHHLWEAM